MKTLMMRTVLALILTFAITPTLAQDNSQKINIPLSRPGEPISLEIDLLSARIEVIGEDREDVLFEVTVKDGTRKIITPSGAKTLTGAGYSLEVDEHDNRVSLDTDWRANKLLVVAHIPRRADLEISTVNDGEIIVSNVNGNLQLSNVNGPITARGISGSVIAESVNDTIDVGFTNLDDDNATSLDSINGQLRLSLPGNTGAQLHIDTSKGEITSDFEVEVQQTEPTVERSDRRGGVEIRIESVIVANINGGGPVIRLTSLHGDIQILKSQ